MKSHLELGVPSVGAFGVEEFLQAGQTRIVSLILSASVSTAGLEGLADMIAELPRAGVG